MIRRILVTGSRDWTDYDRIYTALDLAMTEIRTAYPDAEFVIVHGHCPTGADAMADKFGLERGITVERHPAQWSLFGKSAGFTRNRHMVEKGADLCLAFIRNNSRGASHTARLAEVAGIKTWRMVG